MICILIFLELWVLCKKCKHHVYLQRCYFFLIISPLVANSTKLRFFCSIPLSSFTVMFIINPPYHNRKHKGSRDGIWLAEKNGKRTKQTKVSSGLSNTIVLMHSFEKKNQDFSLLYRNNRQGIHVLLYIHFTKYTPLWIRIIKVTCCNAD